MTTSFFLSRRSVKPDAKSDMPMWQDRLFIILAKNADRCVELFPAADRSRSGDRHASQRLTDAASMAEAASGNHSQSNI
jgi:hypothetical protein